MQADVDEAPNEGHADGCDVHGVASLFENLRAGARLAPHGERTVALMQGETGVDRECLAQEGLLG
eukprot:7485482-Pyramimonas_sp.AAC.1